MTRAEVTSRVASTPLVLAVTAAVAGVLLGLPLIDSGSVAGVTDAGGAVTVALPVARTLLDVAAVAAVGLSLLPLLLGRDRPDLTEPVLAPTRPVAAVTSLVWSVTAFVVLMLHIAESRPQAETITLGDVWAYASAIPTGAALLALAVLALLHAAIGGLAVRYGEKVPSPLRVGIALFAVMLLPVTGHAVDRSALDSGTLSLGLHVMSTVTWTGGLGAMVVLLPGHRTLLAYALPRFSTLAALCLAVAVATGLFKGLVEVGSSPRQDLWTGLIGTPYGQVMILKLLVTCAIALIGAHLRWRLLPKIVQRRHAAFATWATLEVVMMGLTLGLAAVLARAPAP